MKREKIVENFNKILEQFLNDTKCVLGNKYYLLYKAIVLFSKEKPIDDFKFYLQYEEKLLQKDIEFFFADDFQNNFNAFIFKQYALDSLENLREIYYSLEEDNRNNLWEIAFGLLKLAKKYNKIVQES